MRCFIRYLTSNGTVYVFGSEEMQNIRIMKVIIRTIYLPIALLPEGGDA